MSFLRSLCCCGANCASCCGSNENSPESVRKPKSRKATEQRAGQTVAPPPAASFSTFSAAAIDSADADARDYDDEVEGVRRSDEPLIVDDSLKKRNSLSSESRPLVTDVSAISTTAAVSASGCVVDASVPDVRVFEAVCDAGDGGNVELIAGETETRDGAEWTARPSGLPLRGGSLSDISESSEIDLPHTGSEDPLAFAEELRGIESLDSLGGSFRTAPRTDSFYTAPSIPDEMAASFDALAIETEKPAAQSTSLTSDNMEKSITQSDTSEHTLLEELAGRAHDPEGTVHLPPPKRTPPGTPNDKSAAAEAAAGEQTATKLKTTTETPLSICESGERQATHTTESTATISLDADALALLETEALESGDTLKRPTKKARLLDIKGGEHLQNCVELKPSAILLPIREMELQTRVALNRNKAFLLDSAATLTDTDALDASVKKVSQSNRICFLSHVSSHMCPALHQLSALSSASIHSKLVPIVHWEHLNESVSFGTPVASLQVAPLTHSPPASSDTELDARAMHQKCAIREAPASENVCRRAELSTKESTEKLELLEDFPGAIAPEEVLEEVSKHTSAEASHIRVPFEAPQLQDANTSDAEVGQTEELELQSESRALTTCIQRSAERYCAECSQRVALLCAGRSTARDGDAPEANQLQPEASQSRTPQSHHLLAIQYTPAVCERVAHINISSFCSQTGSSQLDSSDASLSAGAVGQSIDDGLYAKWTQVEPAATESARAAPAPTTRIAAGNQVRTLTLQHSLCS